MEVRKKCVQERFRLEMGGLRVDMVKQGAGTTNDGNTARRVFANPTLAADILGIDREKVERVAIILVLFSIQKRVKLNELRLYSLATYKLIVEKIPWYYVPQSVHRMLLHGHQILKECTLPVGMLSEEPQEARNKDYSYFRDLLNMMMVSSDPVISQIYSKDKSCKRRSEVCYLSYRTIQVLCLQI
ncbi:hypothetical protein ONE63_005114 [Megalurothrips usitatus]|uniref:Uncharacterized protein n=1 Tax=Megalurothrips usitatus TaxID=439358 RepID=A0AAV7XVD7_9NEOP|nr:hypothetical protein ONE63_005114 [Megalurothrips usitatus]